MKRLIFLVLLVTSVSCAQTNSDKNKKVSADADPVQVKDEDGMKKAYFASGCFWCSESIYNSVIGVKKVIAGYSGGTGENPNYQNYVQKGHAESIEVTYDPRVIDYRSLLTVYFGSQDVTQQNGQGPDQGSGYRSVIFYQNENEKELIEKTIEEVQKDYNKPIAAEIIPFQKFWEAEEYHQNYEVKNPTHPYIQNVSLPRLNRFQNKHPELLKKSQK